MSRKTKNPNVDGTASMGGDDTFGRVWESMTQSYAYKQLTLAEKHFYTICQLQAHSKIGRACLYNHGIEDGIEYGEHDFVFPSSHLKRYGYDKSNGYRLLKALCDKGFISKLENNKHRKCVNVYSFIREWKNKSPCVQQIS